MLFACICGNNSTRCSRELACAGQVNFFVLAGIALLGAVVIVSHNKTVYSTFYLGLTFLATAGIFLQLALPFSSPRNC